MNYILLILLTMLTSIQLSAQTDQAAKMEHTGKTGHENPFAQCLTPGADSLYSGMISLLDFTKILSYYDSVSTFNLHLEVKPDGKALITTKDNRFGTHAILSFSQKRKTQLTNS